ncbi:MAG: AAA family ATPase [Nitrospirota bacterium]
MTWSALQLRKLSFFGPTKQSVSVEFMNGVNVICGASDTGKSIIAEAIDFMLGGTVQPRDIPERIGYDRIQLEIETAEHGVFTLERSIEGGDFRCYIGSLGEHTSESESTILGAKHVPGKTDNLSGWLLSQIGLSGKVIRKNKDGITRTLSFRDLARLIIVQEDEIYKKGSPFKTGQFTGVTTEYSTLKLLLTGVDDSSLVSSSKVVHVSDDASSKVELIDQWLDNLRSELEDIGADRKEIESQLEHLEKAVESQRVELRDMQKRMDDSVTKRRDMHKERENIKERIDEISELTARFGLLTRHYAIDIERLEAIEESGSLFFHQEKAPCPLCGASVAEQHLEKACEGDVNAIVGAARAEVEKIKKLLLELQQTMTDLRAESKELSVNLSAVENQYQKFDKEIREAISPKVGSVRATFSELVEKRGEIKGTFEIFARIDSLEKQKTELLDAPSLDEPSTPSRTDLSKTILNNLSKQVETILKAWHFPNTNSVYFDEVATDFVIDGKPRGSRGKGLRAITHAAATIALMEYCKNNEVRYPGFVVLDSPLLAYYKPEGQEDDLQGTDLKDQFYQYLASKHTDSQIIIIENEHPTGAFSENLSLTVFTKNPHHGRYGLFPV